MSRQRGLSVEVVAADGSYSRRLDPAARSALDRPTGVSVTTARYTGFLTASFGLMRKYRAEQRDLRLLDEISVVDQEGWVVHEGRGESTPGTADSISAQSAGWMGHAQDNLFSGPIIARDLSLFTGPGSARTQQRQPSSDSPLGGPEVVQDFAGPGALKLAVNGQIDGPGFGSAEAWFDAGFDMKIAQVQLEGPYVLNQSGVNWEFFVTGYDSDFNDGSPTTYMTDQDANVVTFQRFNASGGVGRRYIAIINRYSGTSALSLDRARLVMNIAVIGDHGIPVQQVGAGLDGVLATDFWRWLIDSFCPMLSSAGIQDSDVLITNLHFPGLTTPYDGMLQANAPLRWDFGCWEAKTVKAGPTDLGDFDWQVRNTDPGAVVSYTGRSLSSLALEVIVEYRDEAGLQQRLTSADDARLSSQDPNSPFRRAPYGKVVPVTLSKPTTAAHAAEVGAAAMNALTYPGEPGEISVVGEIRDAAGNWQPAHRVRANDRIIVADDPLARPLIVGETEFNDDDGSMRIAVDSNLPTLEAVIGNE